MINSQGFEGMYVLINPQNGTRVTLGEQFLHDGKTFKIEGGRAPHKPGSTGRIWVREIGDDMHQQEVFPHVHDLRWVMLGGADDPESSFVQRAISESPKPRPGAEILDRFFTIEVLISAKNAIGGKAYWERVQNSDMGWYQRAECDDALVQDYQTARKAHGHKNVRLVEVTKTLVAQAV